MRWLYRALIGLGVLVALGLGVAGAVLWMLASESGTRWLLARVQGVAGDVLSFAQVDGRLLDGLVLRDVRVRLERDEVDIRTLSVDWNPVAALAGVVALDSVIADEVVYRRLPGEDVAEPSGPIDLPVELRIDAARIDSLTLQIGDTAVTLTDTHAAVGFSGNRLTLDALSTTAYDTVVSGNAAVVLAEPIALRVDAEWARDAEPFPASGRLALSGDLESLAVEHALRTPFPATAAGTVQLEDAPVVDLRVSWQTLALPGFDLATSPSGEVTVRGGLERFTVEGRGDLAVDGRLADFTLRSSGSVETLTIDDLTLRARDADGERGSLTIAGDVAITERSGRITFSVANLDPSWWLPEWPGQLSGSGVLTAALEPELHGRLGSAAITGLLRGYPLAVTGDVDLDRPGAWRLTNVRIESGESRAALDGALDLSAPDGALALTADVAAPVLEALVPEARGEVHGQILLTGTRAAPHVAGVVNGRELEYGGVLVGAVVVEADGGLDPDAPLVLTAHVDRIERSGVVLDEVRAAVTGTTRAHDVTVELEGAEWLASLGARGGLDGRDWRGTVARIDVDEQAFGDWRLVEPVDVAVGAGHLMVANGCMQHASGARFCSEATLTGGPDDRLVVSGQNFDLASLRPLLPPQLQLSGIYQLSGSLTSLNTAPLGALAVVGGETTARIAFGESQAYAARLQSVILSATLVEGRLALQGSVNGGSEGSVTVHASIADVRERSSAIDGALEASWSDLQFLTLLSSDLAEVGGRVEANLAIAGTVEEPEVEGSAAWREGRIVVPELGLQVEGIEGAASSRDGRALDFTGMGLVGTEQVRVTGQAQLDPAAGWPMRLRIDGEGLRAVQRPEAEIYVSPDLDVVTRWPDVRVTGTLHVPRARIQISALPEQALRPSPDTVIHAADEVSETQALRISADVTVTLGEDVDYIGLGLTTDVTGQLRLALEPDRSTVATGTLNLVGTYSAYGQTLQLERGQLLFAGPLDDPSLDVRAVRTIEEIRVGVELAGPVSGPRTRIFSTPSMSEADALSYLLLGRPVSGSGDEETATLQSAALSMGLQQALPVVQRIGQSLGLDELSVQSTTEDAGALMAGKYLSPRLYIRYSYGLFNRIGGLLLRFRVNDRFSIETQSGDQKSMDLLYTVEKD